MSVEFRTQRQWMPELERRFAGSPEEVRRHGTLLERFSAQFGAGKPVALFSAPGRTEIGGNHTDHQRGRVLAASVDLDTIAAAAPNGKQEISILSEGYPLCRVSLSDLSPREEEKNTTAALIRGVAQGFRRLGCPVEGFDACVTSNVLRGSGLSSSASFEVLVGGILNGLFFGGSADAVTVAKVGQYAENVYFGKPCGLMDQMASSVGNLVAMDFADPEAPVVERVDFDFSATGCRLCIIDSGADHAELTGEYAAIPAEMKAICDHFGKEVLRQIPRADFYGELPALRKLAGDRAVLRAMHFFAENDRVPLQVEALHSGDFGRFLELVKESGRSSWMYLQNVVPAGYTAHQDMAVALALCDRYLEGQGAFRVHGGGFAGTVQAFCPEDRLSWFCGQMETVLGQGSCHVLSIRPVGGTVY